MAFKDIDCAANSCGDAGTVTSPPPLGRGRDPAGVAALRALLGRLRADGGGDAKHAAGGLEAAACRAGGAFGRLNTRGLEVLGIARGHTCMSSILQVSTELR